MLDTLIPTEVDNNQTDLSKISTLTHYMENQVFSHYVRKR